MQPITILLIDNEPAFVDSIRWFLEQEGYRVLVAHNREDGRELLEEGIIDLAIVDIRLLNERDEKDVSGLDLAKADRSLIPKIIYSQFPTYEAAREALGPRVEGLPPAIDFLGKTEGPEALLTAVRQALLLIERKAKRQRAENQPKDSQPEHVEGAYGKVWVDLQRRTVFVEGHEVQVTPQEFTITRHFVNHPNQVISREEIVRIALKESYDGVLEENRVNNIIRRLREKIEPNGSANPQYLQTVRGHGFKFVSK